MPVFAAPRFTFAAAISLVVSLFVVTMALQNLPGWRCWERLAAAWPWRRRTNHTGSRPYHFLVTLSGVAIAGVGSVFWAGCGRVARFVQQYGQERRHPVPGPAPTTQACGPHKNP
jgi:predicted benzoate:H+ symporter BenE